MVSFLSYYRSLVLSGAHFLGKGAARGGAGRGAAAGGPGDEFHWFLFSINLPSLLRCGPVSAQSITLSVLFMMADEIFIFLQPGSSDAACWPTPLHTHSLDHQHRFARNNSWIVCFLGIFCMTFFSIYKYSNFFLSCILGFVFTLFIPP